MTRPQRFTKKPVTIEAMQWTGTLDSYLDVADNDGHSGEARDLAEYARLLFQAMPNQPDTRSYHQKFLDNKMLLDDHEADKQ